MFILTEIHIISLARTAQAILCVMTLLLLSGCFNSSFYKPNQTLYETPDQYCLKYEEVLFPSKDGIMLYGWFVPAVGDAAGTVIHFNGNFGNLSYYFKQIYWLPFERFNVFTFDYRGYGRSMGIPSRRGIYKDSVAAIEYIMSKPDIDHRNVFVFGQSIGGVNAIVAIAKNDFPQIRAMAIEGAFFSYRQEAQDMMISAVRKKMGNVPCLPLQIRLISFLAVTDRYSPGEFIDRISPIPLLLIHCTQDAYVAYHHSELLYEKAKTPKTAWIIKGCKHLQLFTDEQHKYEYRQKLVRFFNHYRRSMK
ncbi:MAG: alpha/beta hydrolase [Thermodesulfobacteriota bacterium]|nr:alpha/beta hydrolase [Thermodesulfobacteriota bacterium]